MTTHNFCKYFKYNKKFTRAERDELNAAFDGLLPDEIETIGDLLNLSFQIQGGDDYSDFFIVRLEADPDGPYCGELGLREFLIYGERLDKFWLDSIRPVALRVNRDGSGLDFIDWDKYVESNKESEE